MREEPGQREAYKVREAEEKALIKQGYSPKHARTVAQRNNPTPAQKRQATKDRNKRTLEDM